MDEEQLAGLVDMSNQYEESVSSVLIRVVNTGLNACRLYCPAKPKSEDEQINFLDNLKEAEKLTEKLLEKLEAARY